MSQETKIFSEGMTRRSFIKTGGLGLGLIFLAAQGAGLALVSACAKPTADLTVASSVDFNHSHNVTIPGADIDNQPSQKTYTSDGPTHQHAITLTNTNLKAVKDGQTVAIVSTATGTTPHTHTWNIKKA